MLTYSIAILAGVVAGVGAGFVAACILWIAVALSGADAERNPHGQHSPISPTQSQ